MTKPKTVLSSTEHTRSGRPPNRFTMSPSAFKNWHGAREWREDPEKFLKGDGALGLTPDGKLMFEFRRADVTSDCFYVNVRSDDGELHFTLPGPLHKDDFKKLYVKWRLLPCNWTETEVEKVILNGVMPKDFRFSAVVTGVATVKKCFHAYIDSNQNVNVRYGPGWASMVRSMGSECIGVMGSAYADLAPLFTKEVLPKLISLSCDEGVPRSYEVLEATRIASSQWVKKRFLGPTGYVPHHAYVDGLKAGVYEL